jgi:hypothetical protein
VIRSGDASVHFRLLHEADSFLARVWKWLTTTNKEQKG